MYAGRFRGAVIKQIENILLEEFLLFLLLVLDCRFLFFPIDIHIQLAAQSLPTTQIIMAV